MPANNDSKQAAQRDLLDELRDLKSVLDSEADDAIPVLSDVVQVADKPQGEAPTAAESPDAVDTTLKDAHDSSDDIPVLDNATAEAEAEAAEPKTSEQSLDQLLAAEATTSPFALVDTATFDYDSSAAESLIEDGLNEAVQPLTQQMDDEALRVVEELVAEHAEIIRQKLTQRLEAKSKELRGNQD